MITFISGVPGSGKTLYAITKLIAPLIGTHVAQDVDGVTTLHPRTVYTNINGLLLDHEQINAPGQWKKAGDEWEFIGEHDEGLHNWHEWAKPGSVIVYDEFQKAWPPRPNGSAVPPDIQALDTHRHMGVDFILITQNALNVDRHVVGLVGRHLHVRRVGNLPMSMVYEWDHCSKSLLFKNAMAKSGFRFNKKVFKLYKSAEVHTKQPRKIPTAVFVVLSAIIGSAYFFPTFINRITHRQTYSLADEKAKPNDQKNTTVTVENGLRIATTTTTSPFDPSSVLPVLPASSPVVLAPVPVVAGCVQSGPVCSCMDSSGTVIQVKPETCESKILGMARPGQKADITDLGQDYKQRPKTDDQEVFSFLKKSKPTFY